MFSYIKRHWPIYLILTLIAIALGFGAAYVVGVKGSTPETTMNEEVEQEQSFIQMVAWQIIKQITQIFLTNGKRKTLNLRQTI